jgi:beta-fructofuranosidase
MFGWLREDRGNAGAAGWQGAQSLPRVLSLDEDGRVHFEPAEELGTLRGDDQLATTKEARGDCLEIAAEIAPGEAEQSGLTVRRSPGGEEETLIVFDRKARTLSIDRSRSSADPTANKDNRSAKLELAAGETLELRVFVDRSIVEVYANGHTCLTSRIYPTRPDSLGVGVYSRGQAASVKSMKVWTMKPAAAKD